MPIRSRYDVVVVGARCAGAATAMLLARRGLRVLVVDRARRGSDTLSTHALLRPAVVQLHRWGLLDRLAAAGTPPVTRTVFHYGDDRVGITLRPVAGTPALYAPRRTLLDPLLLDAAERAGAEVRTGIRVTGLLRDQAGAVRGVELDAGDGRRQQVRAALTVGADGLRSLVAEQVGAAVEARGRYAGACAYGYVDGLPTDGYEWFYGVGATSGLIPTDGGQTLVFLTRPTTGEPLPTSWSALRAGLSEAWPSGAARLDAARPASTLRRFRGHPNQRRAAWGPGWALVGDAGYYLDPMSAHGISQALRDAELLAAAVRSDAPRAQAMAAFQRARDDASAELFAVVDELASFTWSFQRAQELLLRLSSAVSDEVDLLAALDAPHASRARPA
jgi:2-polyprenyl-6-methoxyphenol hydroxylase-like FAD-dependent oxidoreductase